MEYVVTASEMKRYDTNTTERFAVPALLLMEQAAAALAETVRERFLPGSRVLVAAGIGNNGGDGLAAGRLLSQAGYHVDFFLAGDWEKMTPQTKKQLEILNKYGMFTTGNPEKNEYDIIIDALLGAGLSREVSGSYGQAVEWINSREKTFVLSCDIPTGIDSDTGAVRGTAVRADATVVFSFLKRGVLLSPGAFYAGEVLLKKIGITQASFLGETPGAFTYGVDDLCRLPVRQRDGNKGSFGKVFLIAGSRNMCGACELAGTAVYRSGAGMVRVYTARDNRVILQKGLPEAVLSLYTGEEEQEEIALNLSEHLKWADVLAAGPGIGTSEFARRMLTALLSATELCGKKLLLDADALNLIAADGELGALLKQRTADGAQIVITPHPAEFSRLTGLSVGRIKEDLVKAACDFAGEYGVCVVCKDARTVVASPEGRVYINQSGSSALATAGSGDVLSGVICGLLAQRMELFEGAALGVYLHGKAGELAAKRTNVYSVMARDVVEALKICFTYGPKEGKE